MKCHKCGKEKACVCNDDPTEGCITTVVGLIVVAAILWFVDASAKYIRNLEARITALEKSK